MSLLDDAITTVLEPAPDVEIVDRIRGGDASAFEIIMRRYNQRLYRIARSIIGNDAEAEDVVQEAYVRAFQHLDQFAGRSQFSTWLTRIAVYEASSRRRDQRRLQLVTAADIDAMPTSSTTPDAVENASRQELAHVISDAIDALPAELRTVVALRLIEGVSTAETAECLELSAANVKTRLHRAKLLLRSAIDARLGQEIRQLYAFDGPRCDRIVRTVFSRISSPERTPLS
jgi:RNA polymerase sigma-70 factor (ECF subfamily)